MQLVLADVGGLFAIGFLLISFIGWIINMINQQNPPPAPNRGPQRRPRARDRKVQNEIEQFLQEAMGNKGGGRPAEVGADEIEILEPAPQRRPPQRRPPRRPQPKPASRPASRPQALPSAEQQAMRNPPGGEVSTRHIATTALGKGVSSHVQQHMRERVGQEIEQHLPHAVDRTVQRHLGEFTADDFDPRSTVRPTHRSYAAISDPAALIADLHKPDGMRKAILLQEILAKPRALR